MKILIMRHGEAVMQAGDDSQRPLNRLGCTEAQIMGKWLESLQLTIDLVLVSPYLRTQQTLAELAAQLSCKPVVQIADFITPSDSAEDVHHYIDGLTDDHQCILLVTHMPLVSYLVAAFTYDQHAPIFQTASIAEIAYDKVAMKGELIQLASPADLI